MQAREKAALGALGFILGVTALWWALALWPLDADAPLWLVRTREVCFGAAREALPSPAGWTLLIGEPLAMLAALAVIWGEEVRAALRALARSAVGRVALGGAGLAVLAGLGAATARVAAAGGPALADLDAEGPVPATYPRLDREAPPLALIDQSGEMIAPARYAGRPVLVSFAYGHCATICPLIVRDVLEAQRRLGEGTAPPAVLLVTLDPWRDTPARLSSLARSWELGEDAHVLSGEVAEVERVLDGWNVARSRDAATGEVVHPWLVYVLDRGGRIAYTTNGRADAIVELVRRL